MAADEGREIDYAGLFRQMPVACAVYSRALRLLDANRAYCSLVPAQAEELRGKRFLEVCPLKGAEGSSQAAALLVGSLERCLASGATDTVTIEAVSVGDSRVARRWQVTHVPRPDASGAVTSVLQLLTPLHESMGQQAHDGGGEPRDALMDGNASQADRARLELEQRVVSERLQASELRFRTLANRLPGVVYRRIMHPDGTMQDVYVSDGVEALLGVPASSLMSGEGSLFDFVHPEDRARKLHAMRQASRKGEPLVIEVRKIATT